MEKFLNFIEEKSKRIPFDKLPVTEKSCFCFPLRIGSLVIALLCIIIALGVVIINSGSSYCYPGLDIRITSLFSILIHVILFLGAGFFIYGIMKKVPKATTLFLVSLFLAMAITLTEAIVWLFTSNRSPDKCPSTFIFSGALFMRLFVFAYFLIVVNSYRVYNISENRDTIIRNTQERTASLNRTLQETIEKKIDHITEKK